MKRKTREFIQHLSHDIEDEGDANNSLEESLPLVGMVVMHFNRLEKRIDSAICEAISDRSDSLGLIVLHGQSYVAKIEMFKRICDDVHLGCGVVLGKYSNLIEQLKTVGQLRNLVVHADWNNTDHEGYTYVRLKISSRGMEQEYRQLTADSLEMIIDQIWDAYVQLSDYLEEKENLIAYGHGST